MGRGANQLKLQSDVTSRGVGQPLAASQLPETTTLQTISEQIQSAREHIRVQSFSDDVLGSEQVLSGLSDYFLSYQMHANDVVGKTVFESALETVLPEASKPVSKTSPYDIKIAQQKFGLKTQADQGIKEDLIHISKLMECADSKDFRKPADVAAFMPEVAKRLNKCDRTLMLRTFNDFHPDSGEPAVRYDIVEIPHKVLREVTALTGKDFKKLSAKGSTNAAVYHQGEKAFTLVVDGSDNKLTVRGLRTHMCTKHASVWLPLP